MRRSTPVIAVLGNGAADAPASVFLIRSLDAGMRAVGLIQGRDYLLEVRWADSDASRFAFGLGDLSRVRSSPVSSPEIIAKLNREINMGLDDPKIKARFTDAGSTLLMESPAGFGKLIADETEKWSKVINGN